MYISACIVTFLVPQALAALCASAVCSLYKLWSGLALSTRAVFMVCLMVGDELDLCF